VTVGEAMQAIKVFGLVLVAVCLVIAQVSLLFSFIAISLSIAGRW